MTFEDLLQAIYFMFFTHTGAPTHTHTKTKIVILYRQWKPQNIYNFTVIQLNIFIMI